MKNTYPAVSLVIPMYNEVENVAPFLTEIHNCLHQALTFEMIVVDDGSNDGTPERCQSLFESIPSLRLLRHKTNYGQSAATVSGIRAAKHPWIITMDGDGQNDPSDILNLVKHLPESADPNIPLLIAGNRQKRQDTLTRKLSSRIANGVRSSLLRDDCMDTGCSLKLFSRQVFLQMPHFDHLHRFIPSLIKRAGGKTINVPVNHRARLSGQSKYGVMNRLWVGIVDLFGVMWLNRRPCNPGVEHDIAG